MSHLHFPDGILPIWLWVSAYAVVAVLLALSLWYLSRKDIARKIPLIGVLSAMMIVGMSFEIIALAYHINLAVPTAILLGPAGTLVAAFVTNFFLALFGHGGITVVGLNTLMLAIEGILGYFLFYYVIRVSSLFWRAASATFIALMISSVLAIGITVWVAPQELSKHETGGNGILRLELFIPQSSEGVTSEIVPSTQEQKKADIKRFIEISLTLGAIGWVLESLLSGFVVSYIGRVKPDLITMKRR